MANSGTRTERSCPTPSKLAFPTRVAASAFNKRAHTAGHQKLRAYQCACGRWHLTHLSKREHKTIARRAA